VAARFPPSSLSLFHTFSVAVKFFAEKRQFFLIEKRQFWS
jgi:hypothetical protein